MSTPVAKQQIVETPAEKAVYRKVTLRLLPFLMICYLFAYLDRTNIGFAKLQMQQEMPFLTEAVFGLGAGIFFLAYACLEIPSNMLMHRIGARKTITRIMLLWGLVSAAMLFVSNEVTFYIIRALLGIFEAGFAPGIILFFTYWFPAKRMGRVVGLFAMAGPLGSILGSSTSGLIIELTHNAWGLSGWQWMFLIQGLPAVLLGALFWFLIPDNPLQAKWLNADEKKLITTKLEETKERHHDSKFTDALKNPAVYVMALAYFGIMCGIYAVSFWLPTILHNGGLTNNITLGFATALPYLLVLPVLWFLTKGSDRTGDRFWRSLIPTVVGALALVVAAYASSIFALSYIALCIAVCGVWAAYTIFWAVPTTTLGGTAAAGGIAFINTFGILGGFVAPTIMGFVQDATGSAQGGLMTMVVLLVISAVAIIILPKVMKKPM
ncbi:MFS transporter [Brevibacterium sp. 91QC2O2]|uniref:MFS transporter n=1 Tax=Brevibacterium sp. 91QC2O2 TaxID=2968458 RepID=UPI00211CD3CD|nr:MFS transporter [Brevibacterium sp. 91QC2O2]MCQ9368860.1 MFS transporter [Brevibacterium sp. 91QC2O2]